MSRFEFGLGMCLVMLVSIALACSGGYLPWWSLVFSASPLAIMFVIAAVRAI